MTLGGEIVVKGDHLSLKVGFTGAFTSAPSRKNRFRTISLSHSLSAFFPSSFFSSPPPHPVLELESINRLCKKMIP